MGPSSDDLLALADAVREAARPLPAPVATGVAGVAGVTAPVEEQGVREVGRRGHLRVLRDADE